MRKPAPYISKLRIRNERTGQGISKDGTAFSPSPFPEKGKNSVSTGKTAEKSRTSSSITAEMTGDSCMARAVVPRTAAAVDHADTELIGHRGWEGTGFLCGAFYLCPDRFPIFRTTYAEKQRVYASDARLGFTYHGIQDGIKGRMLL